MKARVVSTLTIVLIELMDELGAGVRKSSSLLSRCHFTSSSHETG